VLTQVRKWPGKKEINREGQGSQEINHFESGKIDILKKSQGKWK